jgi:aromatic-amino-acid transaminase
MIEHSSHRSQPETEHYFSTATLPSGWRERSSTIAADTRAEKLDLRAGVMCNRDGGLATFQVTISAQDLIAKQAHAGYLAPTGLRDFNSAITELILATEDESVYERSFSIQTIGAANALRLAADCLVSLGIAKEIYISQESWSDHRRIFERAGLTVKTYSYYSPEFGDIDRTNLRESLLQTKEGSLLLLQAASHNPTGYDLTHQDWEQVFTIVKQRGLLPLFDLAYPGFGSSLSEDLWPIRRAAALNLDFLVATSCCKAFSLYDARVGALTAVVSSSSVAERLESQIRSEIQASYSSPPRFGAAVIAHILKDPILSKSWQAELSLMRSELVDRRSALVDALVKYDAPKELLRIADQRGMFAWSGLDRAACKRLAEEFAIYIPSNGRICVGAIPVNRIEDVARALIEVSGHGNIIDLKAKSLINEIYEQSEADMLPSPESWVVELDVVSYAERQATSCEYLERLFPEILAATPTESKIRINDLFTELTICHRRQFKDLSDVVAVKPVSDRQSFYFDSMYQRSGIPDSLVIEVLNQESLLSLLAVHAVSYLRGHERYLILRDSESRENQSLRGIWRKFSHDAPRNARLTIECMLDLFDENAVRAALKKTANNESIVMKSIFDHKK